METKTKSVMTDLNEQTLKRTFKHEFKRTFVHSTATVANIAEIAEVTTEVILKEVKDLLVD